ncbi:MAG TPA: GspE/PulE family protein [Solirubrobacterales bacterium]|nr:GspE/PulE family protein [Solirubrobacterales bacterium]
MTGTTDTAASNGPASSASASRKPLPGLTSPSGNRDPRRRLGDVAVELGFVDRELVEQVMAKEREAHVPVGALLIESGLIDSAQLARMLAERNSLDYVDLNQFEVDQAAANLIEAAEARRYRAIPIAFLKDGSLLVATADPANVLGADDIAMATGYEVRRAIATPEGIEALINRLSKLSGSVETLGEEEADAEQIGGELLELRASAEQAPVVKLVHSVIADAVNRGASDIHFDPHKGAMQIRYRVDGVMIDSTEVPKSLIPGLISRIKIMAELDIAERRAPQDGRVALVVDGRQVDIRISTLPVIRGESVVMRILDKDRVLLDLGTLGMRPQDRELILRAVAGTQGAALATGPTGAGKTTTLYALLNAVNTPEKTLISIEDPVEYEIEGIKQIHVNPTAGLTFASGLRSMVRSDPDTLMVGEIRDRETAQIAMEAALTGHLVLSTLHANHAALAAARLVDMGVEPFLIASAMECIVAQRLARRLCDACKKPAELSDPELRALGIEQGGAEIYEPVGCVTCNATGFAGRIGLYEVLIVNDDIRSMMLGKASNSEIEAAAVAAGMHRLRDDGFEKVRQGVTSLAEVLRVLGNSAA